MTKQRKIIAGFVILGMMSICIAIVPPLLRYNARGIPVLDYIRQHGLPTALATSCTYDIGRPLSGLQLHGVRLYTETVDLQNLAGQLLIYPDSDIAARHFGYLPIGQLINGERSVYYSKRKLFGYEHLTVVHVDGAGKVSDVELCRYHFLILYENTPRIFSY